MTDDRAAEAASRRRDAERRARELQELRERLEAGGRITPDDLDFADERLDDAVQRAEDAHDRALSAHRRAAERHREAAELAAQTGHPEKAEHHERAAASEESAALAEDELREADARAVRTWAEKRHRGPDTGGR